MTPLNMTKVAYGATSLEEIHGWFAPDARPPLPGHGKEVVQITTRNKPKRAEEMIGGSVFWILKHQLVARSEIIGFAEAENGRTAILIARQLVDVQPRPRRAHQGWRYLEAADAPPDLHGVGGTGDVMPAHLAAELARLGL
ncbi:DUF1489 family protein [Novosphingobium sp. FSY-8]|uniref:DUF1489 family protein n=2 Tax=Novosphingobium ovatum TaxID=1908523 RepID=A0ABW9XBE6_9SPHN|nr:DUF1489 family protein [Novosphingobium ovatum]